MSSIDNFMKVWFPLLNTDCKGQIFKNVSFCTEAKLSIHDVIDITKCRNNYDEIVISENAVWDKQNNDWLYLCDNLYECGSCLSIFTDWTIKIYQEDILENKYSVLHDNCNYCSMPICKNCSSKTHNYNIHDKLTICNNCFFR